MTLTPCILLVDDDAEFRSAFGAVLRDAGYRVETAVDGHDALARLACAPDLIMLDLQMPLMGGHEFLKRLRLITRHDGTPVLIVTANHDGVPLVGAQRVLRKPFEIRDLLRDVTALLAARF